ncbi:uncharacterized protein FOMMEDRAFT_163694 [Fomitiporia mediterranea MF3/22]|uniref:Uncharacterized protein n=1 Tax=Fomitiporia mediterranea (strain MF3/22) TaxID=694068 RepID=R7SIF9_FOMME|nr:uncharacterized protein FOMMEDRAFT_163694 [Fomitiporia mediterranea MF3/22]EJC97374.1 hypothetical protein FOMMEDRAFT_163694 [Fomitiporia mediterranea MF3/22]
MVNPILVPFLGCQSGLVGYNAHTTIPCFIVIIVYDTVIFSLTLYRAFRSTQRVRLFYVLVRDGIFYYSVMLGISVSAVAVSSSLPVQRTALTALFLPVVKASFCVVGSRISLNLREAARRTVDAWNGTSIDTDID